MKTHKEAVLRALDDIAKDVGIEARFVGQPLWSESTTAKNLLAIFSRLLNLKKELQALLSEPDDGPDDGPDDVVKGTERPVYVLYDGHSADGRGAPDFIKATLDRKEAEAHKKKVESNPYSTGKVIWFTADDTGEATGYFGRWPEEAY